MQSHNDKTDLGGGCCGCHIGEANFPWWNQNRFWEKAASEMILKDDHLLTVREWRKNISDEREDSVSTQTQEQI